MDKYIFKALITIHLESFSTKKNEQILQSFFEGHFLPCLKHLQIQYKQEFSYYYPDEEAEIKGLENVKLNIYLKRECKRYRSVFALSQLILALRDLFDRAGDIQIQCFLGDPFLKKE